MQNPGTCEVCGPNGRVEVVAITPKPHDRRLWEQPLSKERNLIRCTLTSKQRGNVTLSFVGRKSFLPTYEWGKHSSNCIKGKNSYPNPWAQVVWKSYRRAGQPCQGSLCGEPWYERKILVILEVLLWALMHRSQIQRKKNNEKCWLGAQRKEWNICAQQ